MLLLLLLVLLLLLLLLARVRVYTQGVHLLREYMYTQHVLLVHDTAF